MKKIFIMIMSVFFLAGCQSVPPLNFSVPNVGMSNHKIDAELKSITVSLARPDEQHGDIEAGMESVPMFWKSSLEESLNRMAIFRDDADKKVSLSVKVLALNIPSSGFSFTTKTIASYELIDRNSGRILYSQIITSEGVVPVDYAFLGLVRARESINRSIQNNISHFLSDLSSLNINEVKY
ncbi:Uncharacterised protein [Yersinia frederiksenii]|nr:Uncharacterised protein [Yersinia frederiksenii]